MALAKVVIHGLFDWGVQTRNVFYFGGTDATPALGQDLVDNLIDCLMQDRALFIDNYAYEGGTVYDIGTPGFPGTYFGRTGGSLAGTGTSDPLPGQIAMLLNLRAAAIPPNKKRVYLAGQGEGTITNGLWTSTHLARGDAVIADLLDWSTFSGMSCESIIYGYSKALETWASNDLTSGVAEAVPATQRRRRRGRGI